MKLGNLQFDQDDVRNALVTTDNNYDSSETKW